MSDKNLETIDFETEDGGIVKLYILEQTMLAGKNYILVSDSLDEEDENSQVFIMKEEKDEEDDEFVSYEIIEDDEELEIISKVFEEIMDIDIEY